MSTSFLFIWLIIIVTCCRMHVLRSFSQTIISDRGPRIRLFLEQRSHYRTHASRIKKAERPLSRGVLCVCVCVYIYVYVTTSRVQLCGTVEAT